MHTRGNLLRMAWLSASKAWRRCVQACSVSRLAAGRLGVALEGLCGSKPGRWLASRWRGAAWFPGGEVGPLPAKPHTSPRSALQGGALPRRGGRRGAGGTGRLPDGEVSP